MRRNTKRHMKSTIKDMHYQLCAAERFVTENGCKMVPLGKENPDGYFYIDREKNRKCITELVIAGGKGSRCWALGHAYGLGCPTDGKSECCDCGHREFIDFLGQPMVDFFGKLMADN